MVTQLARSSLGPIRYTPCKNVIANPYHVINQYIFCLERCYEISIVYIQDFCCKYSSRKVLNNSEPCSASHSHRNL
ncbi:hypothetical protein CAAN1_14S04412 [[Candida] anglica]|uniref:Uncharacterized protein n=1 Tax=[Candida] anglica TaxID=148631 RepID=A0ABP0EJN6_9ASCO